MGEGAHDGSIVALYRRTYRNLSSIDAVRVRKFAKQIGAQRYCISRRGGGGGQPVPGKRILRVYNARDFFFFFF